jgi:hypothetical protein
MVAMQPARQPPVRRPIRRVARRTPGHRNVRRVQCTASKDELSAEEIGFAIRVNSQCVSRWMTVQWYTSSTHGRTCASSHVGTSWPRTAPSTASATSTATGTARRATSRRRVSVRKAMATALSPPSSMTQPR